MKNAVRSTIFAAAVGFAGSAQALEPEDINIVLIPGLTTDAFYITMNRGAQAAAEALGITVDFQVRGVFGANLFSALGAANGVEAAGASGDVTVIAFDAPQSIVDNIETGLVDAAIAQHPAEIGYFGVVAAYAALTGQSIPTSIGTGFTVINADNVNDEDIARFIYSE